MTEVLDGFLTGLTGLDFVGQSDLSYLVGRCIFDRLYRFDRYSSHTHMKNKKSWVQSENGLEPVNPSKPVKAEHVA